MATPACLAILVLPFFATLVSAGILPGDFSYSGQTSPSNWGKYYPECGKGKQQSPINIVSKNTVLNPNLQPLSRIHKPANASLVDTGTCIGVRYSNAEMIIGGKIYHMKQMHWHSPSEHLIDAVRHPLELHLVHQAEDGSLAVIALLYQYGPPDAFIHMIIPSLRKLAENKNTTKEIPLGKLDITLLANKIGNYWQYMGSLTTPPCSELVLWTILPKLRTVTTEQIKALKSPLGYGFKNNSRTVQPIHGRKVERCEGHDGL